MESCLKLEFDHTFSLKSVVEIIGTVLALSCSIVETRGLKG